MFTFLVYECDSKNYKNNKINEYICSYFYIYILFPIFVSLPLILTFLAANICHFLIATLNFFVFFFRNELRLLSFFFLVLFCQFRSSLSFLCYRCQCNGSREKQSNARSRDYEIFSHLQVTIFFSHARELR